MGKWRHAEMTSMKSAHQKQGLKTETRWKQLMLSLKNDWYGLFLTTLVRQLNYCLVHFRISLDSPQISSFVCGSIHLPRFSLRNMTHLRVHSITPLPQSPIQPLRLKAEFLQMKQITKIECTVRQHEFILITCAILVE